MEANSYLKTKERERERNNVKFFERRAEEIKDA